MIDLDRILTDYTRRDVQFSPRLWAGHYYACPCAVPDCQSPLIGEMSLVQLDNHKLIDAMGHLLGPWTLCEFVTDSALVIKGWELWVWRLAVDGSGTRSTYWHVPQDGAPVQEAWPGFERMLYDVSTVMMDRRKTMPVGVSFETAAFELSRTFGE